MSRTIKAIERYMMPPVRSQARGGEVGLPSRPAKLVTEWQQHGPETLSGYAVRKLRLAFGPTPSVITASAAG